MESDKDIYSTEEAGAEKSADQDTPQTASDEEITEISQKLMIRHAEVYRELAK